MTSLILSTVLCSFFVPTTGPVQLQAWYEHEWPQGERYTFDSTTMQTPGWHEVEAEGWPVYIRLKQGGEQIGQCTYDPAIHIDGFESGTLEEWD